MQAWVLGQRALREAWRTPEAIVPTLFIPLFFLVVNVGQAGKIFPSTSTEFLEGQGYGAFQLPQSLLLAASFGTAALFLVEDIEGGYFDKLRATPISRTSIVLGRLIAEFVKALLISVAIVVLGVVVRDRDRQRPTRVPAADPADRAVGGRLRRLHAADRAQDPQRRGDELRRAGVLPAAVPDAELRPARPAHGSDGDRGVLEPRDLRDGVAALADPARPRLGARSGPASSSSRPQEPSCST